MLNRLRETLFKGLFRARFRYDVFISYSHSDAREYATNLKKQLSSLDFSCFIDEEESPPGLSLGPTLESALKKSAILVLLATERALTRPYIALEVEKFLPTKRTIVPINISGALTRNDEEALTKPPWNIINERNLVWIDETDEAFAKKNPSPAIADGIDKLFKYTRRNARVRTEIATVAAVVLLAAVVAGFQIKVKGGEALRQAERAKAATVEADKQQALATKASEEATTQRNIAAGAEEEARRQLKIAGDAKKEAEHQQEIARTATAEANKQLALANAAKNEADRQQERSRHLSYDADISLAERAFEDNQHERVAQLLDSWLPSSTTKQTDLRGFEWHYLRRLVHRELFTLDTLKPDVKVRSIAFSSNGGLMAAGGGDGVVTVWDMASRNKVATLQGDPNRDKESPDYFTLAFSHDGKLLAIADEETGLKVWNPKGNAPPLWLKQEPLKGSIYQLAFSSDDRTLITGGEDIIFWDISSGTKRLIDESNHFAADQNGKTIAFYSYSERQLKLLDVASTKESGTFKVPTITGFPVPLALSPDGKLLAFLEVFGRPQPKNGRLHLWNLESGETQHIGDFYSISVLFSPDGKTLAVGNEDGFVWLWDVTSKTEQARFYGNAREVFAVSFQPDGTILAASSSSDSQQMIRVWDATSKAELVTTTDQLVAVKHLSFSPDSNLVAVGNSLGEVTIWNAGTQSPVAESGRMGNEITSVAFSSDGKTVSFRSGKNILKLWDVDVKKVVATINGIENHSIGVETTTLISPDGDMVAAAVDTDTIKFWDVRSRKESGALKGIAGHTSLFAFSPDHKFLVTNNSLTATKGDNSAKLWDVTRQKEIVTPKMKDVKYAVFSPKSNVLACIFDYGESLRVWDVHSQSELFAFDRDPKITFKPKFGPVAFSPDGKIMAIGYELQSGLTVVNLFSIPERKLLGSLKGHETSITSISFSPDGKTIATSSHDGTAKLWSATTYQQLISTMTQRQPTAIGSVLFSPDGKTLAVGDFDGTVKLLYAGNRRW